jgi:LysR family transcriptional regulator, glycine cleavage system transcriptional activator
MSLANPPGRTLPQINTLVAFEAAGRLGSFSEAAGELGLTQSAISQQMRKLEHLAGQRLFLRKGTGVRLTSAGEILFKTVGATLAGLAAGLDRIEPYKNKNSVVIACPADFARGWLMPRLAGLRALHPSVEVWIVTQTAYREIDRIDLDLIVSPRPIHTADVECVPLLEDRSVAVCARALHARLGKLTFAELLARVPLLLLESEPEWGGLLRGRRAMRGATIDDGIVLLDAVERELGVGYVSAVAAAAALDAGRLSILSAVPAKTRDPLWLMRTRLKPRTPVADLAFRWLLEAAAGAGDATPKN